MCGIAGYLQLSKTDQDVQRIARSMADCIAYRGPDDSGVWADSGGPRLALSHRRLSIIDTSKAGAQPMASASGRYVIVYNGEIYNFRALREKLEKGGHSFKGHSDTEVLLAAVEEWGIKSTLKRAAGMFAIALYDRKTKELTLARDRMGKKPLYFGWDKAGQGFAFASELKALCAAPGFEKPDVNKDALGSYLQWRYVPDPMSIYDGIWKLPPSTFFTLPLDDFAKPFEPKEHAETYWDFHDVIHQPVKDVSEDAALDGLENVLEQAVSERMISDVPLGAFLSGGVDSSLVVALMQKQAAQPVNTFTVAFDDPRYNEGEAAADIAARLGTNHTEMTLTPEDALNTVQHISGMFGEPFADPSAIPTYHVCRLAKKSITVALSGDGGDESFGGYSWYMRAQKFKMLMALPRPLRKIGAQILQHLPISGGRFSEAQRHKIARLLSAQNNDDLYPLLLSYWSAVTGQMPQNKNTPYADLKRSIKLDDPISRMMAYDTRMFLAGDVLTKTDRCAMVNSMELRSPLLDHRVVEYAWTLPMEMKIRGGTQKYALKQLLRRYLPDELIDRPKRGFSIPHGTWLRTELKEWAGDLLSDESLKKHDLIAPEFVRPYWEAHRAGQANYGHYLWTIVCLQSWAEGRG